VEKDGKKVETLFNNQCGGIYGLIAPSKNMAKPPKQWETFDVVFHSAKGEKGKVDQKARVTLVWNGEKVIDNAEIDSHTISSRLTHINLTEPGPLGLQGWFAGVAYRNARIKPLAAK
jgi:Domain of Unknown Function (DUF1080)